MKDTQNILKLISSISKSFFPLVMIKNILQATIPYVNIIFSYLILDGIISTSSKGDILNNVYWMISLNLGLGLLLSFSTRLLNVRTEYINHTMKSEIARKAQTLDYEQLEKKESLEFLRRAEEGSNSHGGVMSFCDTIGELITHIITIVYSIILLSGLFVIVPKENPTVLEHIFNSPLIVIALAVLFTITLVINYRFAEKVNSESYAFFQKNVDNNRKFNYFFKYQIIITLVRILEYMIWQI
jgi:ATP-binding cassette subfamily B protein